MSVLLKRRSLMNNIQYVKVYPGDVIWEKGQPVTDIITYKSGSGVTVSTTNNDLNMHGNGINNAVAYIKYKYDFSACSNIVFNYEYTKGTNGSTRTSRWVILVGVGNTPRTPEQYSAWFDSGEAAIFPQESMDSFGIPSNTSIYAWTQKTITIPITSYNNKGYSPILLFYGGSGDKGGRVRLLSVTMT